jgi:hypothetical protein
LLLGDEPPTDGALITADKWPDKEDICFTWMAGEEKERKNDTES